MDIQYVFPEYVVNKHGANLPLPNGEINKTRIEVYILLKKQ